MKAEWACLVPYWILVPYWVLVPSVCTAMLSKELNKLPQGDP